MAAGEQVALQPALAEVLAEDLHDAAVRGEMRRRRPRTRPVKVLVGDLEERARAGSRRSRRARRRGSSCSRLRSITSRRKRAQDAGGLALTAPGLRDLDGVVAEVRQRAGRAAAGRRWRADWRPCAGRLAGRVRRAPATRRAVARRTAPRAGSCASTPRAARGAPGCSRTPASGTWCERQEPSIGWPSTSFGPVQPLGVRRTIIGQRGRSVKPPLARAAAGSSAISSTTSSSVAAISWCIVVGSSPSTKWGS